MLTIPRLPSSSPIFITFLYTLYCRFQISKDLLTPVPYIQLTLPSGISCRPITLTKSKIKSISFPPNNFSLSSPSQFHCQPVTQARHILPVNL